MNIDNFFLFKSPLQELQDVDLPGLLQEETDAQGAAEESGGPPEHSKKQRLQEDEQDQLKHRLKREHEEGRQREEERKKAEELRLVEERHLMLEEERRQREEEERRKREQEERMKREEEERVRRELEEKRRKEEEERQERKMREEEERKRREDERKREEEERRRHEGERLRLEEEKKIREAEEAVRKEKEAEKRRLRELEEKQRREEEERLREEERKQLAEEEERMKEEEEEEKNRQQEERERASVAGEEWKRKAEEMRWKEMEERQPFTFKVSSGEKQILFQKVNLTPVTPGSGQQAASSSETGEGAKASSSAGADSPTRSSIYVPHTAILVTGAQLCGTAVNLDQIKDTACKSLLGLGAPTKTKTSPDRKSGKTKSLNLSAAPSDQSSAAVLAEWASIRSKIFKGVEEGKYEDNQEPTQSRKENQSRPTSEDLNQSPFPHPNLRKTLSASAKFSITPARKKFGDSNRNSEILCQDERDDRSVESVSPEPFRPGPSPPSSSSKTQTRVTKSVRISDNSEECMFAKDLPSFLVPCPLCLYISLLPCSSQSPVWGHDTCLLKRNNSTVKTTHTHTHTHVHVYILHAAVEVTIAAGRMRPVTACLRVPGLATSCPCHHKTPGILAIIPGRYTGFLHKVTDLPLDRRFHDLLTHCGIAFIARLTIELVLSKKKRWFQAVRPIHDQTDRQSGRSK